MARYEYRLVDVFTARRFGGNPLAVFPDAADLAAADMQAIARELNLSETTFVLPSPRSDCDYQVRIFTPRTEMPMAGHPTIGTAFVLQPAVRVVFLEGVGPIAVERTATAAGAVQWWMTQPLPAFGGHATDRAAAAALLGISTGDLDPALPVEVVSTGAPFLFVPLRDRDVLGRVRVVAAASADVPQLRDAYGVFCFTTDSGDPRLSVRSRMFAPWVGVAEDPATGSGSGALGAYLVRYGMVPAGTPARLLSLQGVEMGRPSEIHIEVIGAPEAISGIRVGGECVAVGGGYMEL